MEGTCPNAGLQLTRRGAIGCMTSYRPEDHRRADFSSRPIRRTAGCRRHLEHVTMVSRCASVTPRCCLSACCRSAPDRQAHASFSAPGPGSGRFLEGALFAHCAPMAAACSSIIRRRFVRSLSGLGARVAPIQAATPERSGGPSERCRTKPSSLRERVRCKQPNGETPVTAKSTILTCPAKQVEMRLQGHSVDD